MRLAQVALPLVLIFCGWQQPVPTNSIHITGEPGASVQVSGSYQHDGAIIEIERHSETLPVSVPVYNDARTRIRIETDGLVVATIPGWRVKGVAGIPITCDIPARK